MNLKLSGSEESVNRKKKHLKPAPEDDRVKMISAGKLSGRGYRLAVKKIDKETGEVVAEFATITEASDHIGVHRKIFRKMTEESPDNFCGYAWKVYRAGATRRSRPILQYE